MSDSTHAADARPRSDPPPVAPPGRGRRRRLLDLGLDRGAGRRRGRATRSGGRSCILLWMTGGPSQIDTFDPKPGHANGGPFKAIETSVPGITISEHLPKLARQMKDIAIIRSMSTKEGDHGRATFNLRTGYMPPGADPLPDPRARSWPRSSGATTPSCPNFVSIAPYRCLQPGRVRPGLPRAAVRPAGRRRARALGGSRRGDVRRVGAARSTTWRLPAGVDLKQADARLGLLDDARAATSWPSHPGRRPVEPPGRLRAGGPADALDGGQGVRPRGRAAPRCATPTAGTRSARAACWPAGWSSAGVPFVEVTLSAVDGSQAFGWDTHQQNFDAVKKLSGCSTPAGRP